MLIAPKPSSDMHNHATSFPLLRPGGGGRKPWNGVAVVASVCVLLAFLLVTGSVQAQHVLRGYVVDTTGADLAGVEIVLTGTGHSATTDSKGRYTVTGIPPGRFEVVFRRLGYAPLAMFRSFMGDTGTAVVDVELASEVVVLPEVETRGRGPAEVPLKLREWARRRQFNVVGKFWDDSLLRTKEYQRLPELLQGIGAVRIIRAAGGRFLASARGSYPKKPLDPRVPAACYVEVLLDGARLSSVYTPANLDDIPIQQIAAMELYRSISELPIEFQWPGSACGVLAIWTR